MIRTLLLFAIITALSSLPLQAQSDDGWFTGRLLLCCTGSDGSCRAQVDYTHYYNFSNHFSSGTGVGVIMGSNAMMPVVCGLRLMPFARMRVNPVILCSGGYAVPLNGGSGASIITPRIGLETGRLARIRYAMDAGCQILGGECCWLIGAGILF